MHTNVRKKTTLQINMKNQCIYFFQLTWKKYSNIMSHIKTNAK